MFSSKKSDPLGKPWGKTWWKHMKGRMGRDMTYTVFDCEMTGLNPKQDEVIAIGAVKIRQGRVCMADRFYRVLRTEHTEMSRDNVLIHRMGHDLVTRGQVANEVLADFLEFLGDSVGVAHGSSLDLGFLKALGAKSRLTWPDNPVLDTAHLYKWMCHHQDRHREVPSNSLQLSAICTNLTTPLFTSHHAFFDAMSCAGLFLKLMTALEMAGNLRFGDMIRASKPRLSQGGI